MLAATGGPSSNYLFEYLTELGATSVVRELHYVDRHYLGDFCAYHATSFRTPRAHCERFHFFRGLSADELDALITQAYAADETRRGEIERALDDAYLGFVVRRPLPGASLGRTVLRTYPADGGRRHYAVVRPYKVNLGGLRLTVNGLAYQQQDRGAAVCASTALWCALQRVAYVAGQRTPTPSMITAAAGSPYPASYGLNQLQMAQALATLGYAADRFVPGSNQELFIASVVSCLQSQLPVILLVKNASSGHAVTVTGYSEPPDVANVDLGPGIAPVRMRAAAVSVIYVHDDNLGSHAHYELSVTGASPKTLKLHRGRSNKPDVPWWSPDDWDIEYALVPKPAKLRLPISNLFQGLAAWRHALQTILPGRDLDFGTRFVSGVNYKREAFAMGLEVDQLRQFLTSLTLPRHVGIVSVHDAGVHRLDVVLDVSQIQPDDGMMPFVHALVAPGIPARSPGAMNLQVLAQTIGDVPLILAPPTPPAPDNDADVPPIGVPDSAADAGSMPATPPTATAGNTAG